MNEGARNETKNKKTNQNSHQGVTQRRWGGAEESLVSNPKNKREKKTAAPRSGSAETASSQLSGALRESSEERGQDRLGKTAGGILTQIISMLRGSRSTAGATNAGNPSLRETRWVIQ